MSNTEDSKKQVIGLLGEMSVVMAFHERGWQVYRPVLDENIDFVLTRYYCTNCKKFTSLHQRITTTKNKKGKDVTYKAITNLCDICHKAKIRNIVRFIQVKTSEGIRSGRNVDNFSFHAKLRHHVDPRTFYVWIAVHPGEQEEQKEQGEQEERIDKKRLCYYVFHYNNVQDFDNIELPSYQESDNQKTALRINAECEVITQGSIHNYDCFREFLDNFEILDTITSDDE